MKIHLKPCDLPTIEIPLEQPRIPASTYQRRCRETYAEAGTDWVVVYADREHSANILFLSGFEPRFEEALLLLGSNDRRILVVGNESESYTVRAGLPGVEVMLSQTMSLMGQDRTIKPSLTAVLREAGLSAGQSFGVVGWKYLEEGEWTGAKPAFFVSSYLISVLEQIAADPNALSDVTPVLMHEATGQRSIIDADQIAAFEWASARASAAVWRAVRGTRVGDSELEAAARIGYAGEPLSCHVMFSSASEQEGAVIGLASPTARRLKRRDGVTVAVGYWGGLSSRAGLLDDFDEDFLKLASSYFEALVSWYQTAEIGVLGGEIFSAVTDVLAKAGLKPALNPGHLVSYDEWSNSPVRPGSKSAIVSGMPFQIDIIPVPQPAGRALNCEDAVTFADQSLRAELKERHPLVWDRIERRRDFMRRVIGVDLKESILPMSNTPLWLPPFWLVSDQILVNG
jgi:hypothetical protein